MLANEILCVSNQTPGSLELRRKRSANHGDVIWSCDVIQSLTFLVSSLRDRRNLVVTTLPVASGSREECGGKRRKAYLTAESMVENLEWS
jgi:hypothetical protein